MNPINPQPPTKLRPRILAAGFKIAPAFRRLPPETPDEALDRWLAELEQQFKPDEKTGTWECIFDENGTDVLGSILVLDDGVEAFDADKAPFGRFADETDAIEAVSGCQGRRSNGGDASTITRPCIELKPASDIDTRTVMVTFFPNKSAQRQRRGCLTLPRLAEQIRLETAPTKLELPWLKMMTFGDARSRKLPAH